MRLVLLFILCYALPLPAQIPQEVTPYSGMGDSDQALYSPWALFSNPAGVSRILAPYAGISYRHIPDLKALDLKAMFLLLPSRWGTWGVSFTHFGYEHYHIQSFGFVYGKQLAKNVDLGVRINYLHAKVAKQEHSRSVLNVQAGMILSLYPTLRLGLHVSNPFDVANKTGRKEMPLPVAYTAGISWDIDELFLLALKMSVVDDRCTFLPGVRFNFRGIMAFLVGFNTRDERMYAGVSIFPEGWELSVNYDTGNVLGNVTGIALGKRF